MPQGPNKYSSHITTADLLPEFANALESNPPVNATAPLVMEIRSTAEIPSYAFWGATPGMREWTDERVRQGLAEYASQFGQKKWELTVDIQRDLLLYQRTSELRDKLNGLARGVADHRDIQVTNFLNTVLAASGTNAHHMCAWEATSRALLSSSAHVWGSSGNWINLLTGSSAGVFSAATLTNAIKRLKSVKDDQGKNMGISPTHIFHAASIADTVYEVLATPLKIQASYTGDIASWVNKFNLTPVELKGLTDGYWLIADCSKSLKPIVVITNPNCPDEYITRTDPATSDEAFNRDVYEFGVTKHEDYWAGVPYLVVGGNNA